MTLTPVRPVWLCALVLSLGACGWIGDSARRLSSFLEPEMQLLAVSPDRVGLNERRYRAHLRVVNPNPDRLHAMGLALRLEIDDYPLLSGVADDVPILHPYSEIELTVEVAGSEAAALEPLSALLASDEPAFAYQLEGRLSLDRPRRERMTLRSEGRVGAEPVEEERSTSGPRRPGRR